MAEAAASRRGAAAAALRAVVVHHHVVLVLLLVLPVAQPQAVSVGAIDAVRLVEEARTRTQLLAFKASFDNGDQVLSYWTGNTSYCTWHNGGSPAWRQGITCNEDGEVTHIIVQGPPYHAGLVGTIPPDGWQLPGSLEYLDLGGNSIQGPLPDFWLPQGLRELNLYSNRLSSTLPASWWLPATLDKFLLHENQFTGTLPAWSGASQELRVTIQPGNPGLCGEARKRVPGNFNYTGWEWLNKFPPLKPLPACNAGSRGPSPPPTATGGGSSDAALLLAFKDTFTNGAEVLSNWTGDNFCTWMGVVCELGMRRIIQLNLFDLGLIGTTTNWTLPDTLQRLNLENNKIEGPLPVRLPQSLGYLNLARNNLTGGFRDGAWIPPQLHSLFLHGNPSLGGTISSDWYLPPTLRVLNLYNTSLGGPIPDRWQLPQGLTELVLAYNQLTALPQEWELPDTLQILHLDQQPAMSGTLPGSGWKLGSSLRELQLWYCNLSGTIDPALVLPPSMKLLALHINKLTGPLPDWPSLQAAPQALVTVLPENAGLCGAAPPALSTKFVRQWDFAPAQDSLDSCTDAPAPAPAPAEPPAPAPAPGPVAAAEPQVSSSPAVGAVVGAVVASVCAVAAGLALWWYFRRRKSKQLAAASTTHGSDPDFKSSKAFEDSLLHLPHSALTVDGLKALQRSLARSTLAGSSNPSTWTIATSQSGGSSVAPQTPDAAAVAAAVGVSTAPLAGQPSINSLVSAGSSGPVDIKPWLLPFTELELHNRIGAGSYGTVFRASWHQTQVAVKVLLSVVGEQEALSLSSPLLAGLQAEASTMASLRHPCCVQFLGVCTTPPCIVSEFCSRGSLTDVLRAARAAPDPPAALSWARRLGIAAEAAAGMAYLHSRAPPVVHRDLKSPNILIDADWHAKIADYNLARVMDDSEADHGSSAVATNPRWLSPEVLQGARATFASDAYALGIILWELATFELPWAGQPNPFTIYKEITSGKRPPLPADLSTLPGGTFPGMDRYVQLMEQCWAQQPADRPTFADIVTRLRELAATC